MFSILGFIVAVIVLSLVFSVVMHKSAPKIQRLKRAIGKAIRDEYANAQTQGEKPRVVSANDKANNTLNNQHHEVKDARSTD